MFNIIRMDTNERVMDGGKPLLIEDGAAAAAMAKRYSDALPPHKYQVRRAEGDPKWREREQARLDSGHYTPVDWSIVRAKYPDWQPIADHLVHMARKGDPDMVAYTPDDEFGQHDRQLSLRVGSYLTKFYTDVMSKDDISRFVAQMRAKHDQMELKFATTPDEIEHVYTNGPTSCMSHPPGNYACKSFGHPTRAYGAGDLAIAYLERQQRITARAICWPEKKRFGRIYGDADRMYPMLEAEGFVNDGRFDGARLIRRVDTRKSNQHENRTAFAMPYVDGYGHAYDDGEFIRLGSPPSGRRYPTLDCGSTNGLSYSIGQECPYCHDWTEGWFRNVYTDQHTMTRRCARCTDARDFRAAFKFCTYENAWVANEHVQPVPGVRDQYASTWWLAANTVVCARSGRRTLMQNTAVIRNKDGVDERWDFSEVERHAAQCAATSRYYAIDALISVGGMRIAREVISRKTHKLLVKSIVAYTPVHNLKVDHDRRRRDSLFAKVVYDSLPASATTTQPTRYERLNDEIKAFMDREAAAISGKAVRA